MANLLKKTFIYNIAHFKLKVNSKKAYIIRILARGTPRGMGVFVFK